MNVDFLDLTAKFLEIKDEISHSISSVMGDSADKYVRAFEEEFSEFLGAKFCIGVANGLDALYIAMHALGIGPGDEVITAANARMEASEAITMTGARVVFADCDPRTHNIDPEKVEKALTSRTKAVLPVHLYGHAADMLSLNQIAKNHGLFLIEDAAQAHGAELYHHKVGTLGDIACFSFYPGKNLDAYGDAGAIVTNSDRLAAKCREFTDPGPSNKYDPGFKGFASKMDGVQAAVLRTNLGHLGSWTEKRRRLADLYRSLLDDCELATPVELEGAKHVYHRFVIRVRNRAQIKAALKRKGIATGIHYPVALPNLPVYQHLGHRPEDFPVATQYSGEILSLPMYPQLSAKKVEYVCTHIRHAVEGL